MLFPLDAARLSICTLPHDSCRVLLSIYALPNLLLSSCPGKKVRLTGPVNGRSAVCRDLQQDLRRMKDLGVGCLVW